MKIKLSITAFFIICFVCVTNAQFTKIFDFTGNPGGRYPHGSFISDGTYLYGMTLNGGTGGENGIVLKIKPDGTGYSKIYDFGTAFSDGGQPYGSLISEGIFLFGMTYTGGINSQGVIFKIKPNGTAYSNLHDFGSFSDGRYPHGSLISDGTFLYGMTAEGGTNNEGTIFRIKSDGTGDTVLLNFSTILKGSYPYGSLISDGSFLYGMTSQGGTNNSGVIFKIKPNGTGYSKLMDFNVTNGKYPYGSLISDGTFLYGMTSSGGVNGVGTIFKIKPDGTGYSNLHNFAVGIGGYNPSGSLISDGTYLFGMTIAGGTNDLGVICKIKSDGTGYFKLFDFNSLDGSAPEGDLFSDGTFLYGMTRLGGANSDGTIFKLGLTTEIDENNTDTNFSVFPNPSNGIFNLDINEHKNLKTKEVKVYNILSECVYQLTDRQINSSSNLQIDLNSQPNGIYFINIKSENGTTTKKLIIQK